MIGVLPTVGPTELMVLIGIVAILFGIRRLPELTRSVGQALGELRRVRDEDDATHPEPR